MLIRNNRTLQNNQECNPQEQTTWNADLFKVQGDAIYDYERVPAEWSGFDEQPIIYQYGDGAAWQNNSDDGDKPRKRAS